MREPPTVEYRQKLVASATSASFMPTCEIPQRSTLSARAGCAFGAPDRARKPATAAGAILGRARMDLAKALLGAATREAAPKRRLRARYQTA